MILGDSGMHMANSNSAADMTAEERINVLVVDDTPQNLELLSELLTRDGSLPVSEVMTENLKSVHIDADPMEILEVIAKYDLIAVPVLDEDQKMAGIVTVDDILERFLPLALKHKRHPSY